MGLIKKKALFVIAPKNYRDEEYFKPRVVLMSKGINITTASLGVDEATGTLGGKAKVDISVYKANSRDYDSIIFVGGAGAKIYYHDRKVHELINEFAGQKKIIGAICIAPVILAYAGILKGIKITCFPAESAKLKKMGAKYLNLGVVRDGNIFSAAGPDNAQEFGEALAKLLSK